MTAVETIGELFARPGARDHMGEPVPIGEHMLQAGALAEASAAEVTAFEALPFSRDAVSVRRWDDQAKDLAAGAPRFAHFTALLDPLVRM